MPGEPNCGTALTTETGGLGAPVTGAPMTGGNALTVLGGATDGGGPHAGVPALLTCGGAGITNGGFVMV